MEKEEEDFKRRETLAAQPFTKEFAQEFLKDKEFLDSLLQETVKTYRSKFAADKTSKETLKELNWRIMEIVDLINKATTFHDIYNKPQKTTAEGNSGLNADFQQYLRDLFMKKRTPATHVMVFMVSSERRAKKPYSLPVLYVPYKGMTTDNLRRLTGLVIAKMKG